MQLDDDFVARLTEATPGMADDERTVIVQIVRAWPERESDDEIAAALDMPGARVAEIREKFTRAWAEFNPEQPVDLTAAEERTDAREPG